MSSSTDRTIDQLAQQELDRINPLQPLCLRNDDYRQRERSLMCVAILLIVTFLALATTACTKREGPCFVTAVVILGVFLCLCCCCQLVILGIRKTDDEIIRNSYQFVDVRHRIAQDYGRGHPDVV